MKRNLFVLINHPVECRLPYVVSTFKPEPFIEKLYKAQSEKSPFLSKKVIEKLCIFPMTGPRYSLLKIEVPEMK
jgi:hypothetical protein